MDLTRFRLLKASIAPSTAKTYGFGVAAYFKFCEIYNLQPYQSKKRKLYPQLERFITWRLQFLNGTYATTISDIAAIQVCFVWLRCLHTCIACMPVCISLV